MARPVRVTKAVRPSKQARAPKASQADRARIAAIVDGLEALYPDAHCELDFETPFQLLVATILSAQTTDVRVNMVTPKLFAKYGTPATLAAATPREIEPIIMSTGFYRNKTKSILGAARLIMEDFDGKVPDTMDELLTLPGVARKTANVVLGSAYGKNEGFVVDTHVMRLAQRLRLTRNTEPPKIEPDLMAKLPREKWTKLGHQLIWHGRRVCFARKPKCGECALAPHCPSAFKV
ncbi:MAG TPA: endonuclease III [Polyangia bacterium]|jgi:endonuclease-3|nr:endonuclease III [Polyangia bacterium]